MTAQVVERIVPIHVRGAAHWVGIGAYDGYFRATVESYNPTDGKPLETLGFCGHRHALARKAHECATRMVRARAARAAAKARR